MNEAELTFCEVLGCDRPSLYLNKDSLLQGADCAKLSSVLKRRAEGEPLQYILGRSGFFGLDFKVSPAVLIPRPETEILVEAALRIVRKFVSSRVRKLKILDLGTGSGCIAVSLAKSLPQAEVHACDISAQALEVAKENAAAHGVKINFFRSDLFADHKLSTIDYSLIISNPPYIPAAEIDRLQPEVRQEPRIALDGGNDGLHFFRRIIKESAARLQPGGLLAMELGFGQAQEVKNIFQKYPCFEIIEVLKDYRGIERVIIAGRRDG